MKTSDFDYQVPEELIAHQPAKKRDHSRLMVLHRDTQTIEHKHFYDIVNYLNKDDLLVLNNTKVIPARLLGVKEGGSAKIEVFLLSGQGNLWKCLVKPGKRLKVGSRVIFGNGKLTGTVIEKIETGEQVIEFSSKTEIFKLGKIPLPPYIKNKQQKTNNKQYQNSKDSIFKRYQTVYAEKEGASAAPTAGLHFTPQLLKKVKAKKAYITLHTGLGTFQPVRTENIEDHPMHEEYFEISRDVVAKLALPNKRVVAVGTTVVRALETGSPGTRISGYSDLFIYPGYKFKTVDAMITNFHWPRSTLIMLVSAFAGKDFVMRAYKEAIAQKYRFFSFGDAMLIL